MVSAYLKADLYIYNGTLTEDKYNQFFNPNLCHVCKLSSNEQLISCNKCYSIYYCSEEHKMLHKESHWPVCQAIELWILNDPEWYTRRCNLEDWIKLQEDLKTFIYVNILRSLEPFEKEMCICAKSCFVCHQRTNLHTCTICYSTNYCNDHEVNYSTQHISCCKDLLLLLNLNIYSMTYYVLFPHHVKFTKFVDLEPSYDMVAFINEHMKRSFSDTWKPELYIYSDYMTSTLTFCHACKELRSIWFPISDEFVVHIISGSTLDVISLPAFELALHMYRHIKKLHIVMIQPEKAIELGPYNHLCRRCELRKQKIYFENVVESYLEYVNSESYKEPNVIMGCEPVFDVKSTWSESLTTVLTRNCGILLIARSENQASEYIHVIENIAGTTRNYKLEKNDFRSYRPYRDYETGGIYFRNVYFVMCSPVSLIYICNSIKGNECNI